MRYFSDQPDFQKKQGVCLWALLDCFYRNSLCPDEPDDTRGLNQIGQPLQLVFRLTPSP